MSTFVTKSDLLMERIICKTVDLFYNTRPFSKYGIESSYFMPSPENHLDMMVLTTCAMLSLFFNLMIFIYTFKVGCCQSSF
jgi:tRNA threonylcarbamoyladenosine modification (KEOPS) complex Cgi121 subunit